MLFLYYLKEVKYRIFYCLVIFCINFCIGLYFSQEILFLLVKPLLFINKITTKFSYFIFTNMTDVLYIYIKIALIFALILVLPIIIFQVWFFLIQGLYNYEKNFLFLNILLSLFLFFGIVFILYKYIIPFIWFFFLNFELTSSNSLFGVYYEARINDYVDFMLYIYLIFCGFLQFPILMVFVLYFKIISVKNFIKYRKYFIVFFFILGGVLSPPDVFSQFLISVPIIIIYEIIIFLYLVSEKFFK